MAAAPVQLSPLRNHAFHGGHDSLSTIASLGSSYPSDYAAFDGGDVSPVVPEFGARSGSSQSRHFMPPAERSLPNPNRQGVPERQPVIHPDDETESLTADRSTWQTHPDGREPTTSTMGTPLGRGKPRESAMSALSRESTDGDPFHYTVCPHVLLPRPNRAYQDHERSTNHFHRLRTPLSSPTSPRRLHLRRHFLPKPTSHDNYPHRFRPATTRALSSGLAHLRPTSFPTRTTRRSGSKKARPSRPAPGPATASSAPRPERPRLRRRLPPSRSAPQAAVSSHR
mgnify:FL=1